MLHLQGNQITGEKNIMTHSVKVGSKCIKLNRLGLEKKASELGISALWVFEASDEQLSRRIQIQMCNDKYEEKL